MIVDQRQITVVIVKSIFTMQNREIRTVPWSDGLSVADVTQFDPRYPEVEFVHTVNGRYVAVTDLVMPGDCVAVCPVPQGGGDDKNPLRIIAFVALAVAVSVWAPGLAPAAWGKAGVALVGSAMMLGGSLLINAVLPPAAPDTPQIGTDVFNESPTYGWGPLRQTEGQGRCIAILFGKARVAGHVITKFVETSGQKQYYNIMLGVAVGYPDPITISDVRLNDQPSYYFDGVTVYTREGGVDDELIEGFDQVVYPQEFASKLIYNNPVQAQTNGNAVQRIEIDITAPYGIYYTADDGTLLTRQADVKVEYRLVGAGTWTLHSNQIVSGKTSNPVRKTIVLNLAAGEYEIQLTRTNTESTLTRERTTIYFVGMREIVKRSLIYPGLGKYAVTALATDQLSGSEPAITALAERETVQVWNPYTEEWDTENADNPGWAYYALANTHHDIPPSRMFYDEIKDFADYCAADVGGRQRFKIGLLLDTESNFWTQATLILQIGRARPIRRGTRYGVVAEMPSTPVQMFSMGNITAGSFKLTYLSFPDRANCVEVTYKDEERDYTTQTLAVYTDEYDAEDAPDNRASKRIYGCPSREQAIADAAFLVNCTNNLTRSIEFGVDIPALATQTGDLFYFNHEVPLWGSSGRIVAASPNTITIDKSVQMNIGQDYAILLNTADDTLLDKTIGPYIAEDATIFDQSEVPLNPEEGDIWEDAGSENLLLYSEDASNSYWYKVRCTIDPDVTLAPDGTVTADKIVDNTGTVPETRYVSMNTFPYTAGLFYVASRYVKAAEYGSCRLIFTAAAFYTTRGIDVDLSDGSVYQVLGNLEYYSVEDAGEGWWRISIGHTCVTTAEIHACLIYPTKSVGDTTHVGDGVSGIYIWGAMMTVGYPGVTRYIPTVDTPVSTVGDQSVYIWSVADSRWLAPADYVWSENTGNILFLSSPFTTEELAKLAKYDPYQFGIVESYKRIYRCTSVSRKGDLAKTLTGLEYNASLLSATKVIELPDIPLDYASAYGVFAHEFMTYAADGTYQSNIGVSWHSQSTVGTQTWEVWLKNNSADTIVGPYLTTALSMVFPSSNAVIGNSYTVYVVAAGRGPVSDGTNTAEITINGKDDSPPDVAEFTVEQLPDGTRQFTMAMTDRPIDFDGFQIGYKLGTSATWEEMTNLTDGLIKYSPFENNQLPAGIYVFGCKAFDTSGNESVNDLQIVVELGDPRLGSVIAAEYPSGVWGGTLTDCWHDQHTGYLVAGDTKTWADLATDGITWETWTSWARSPVTTISYEHTTIDLGSSIPVTPLVTVVGVGAQTIEMNYSDDGSSWSGWTSLVQVTARYFKIRITMTVSAGTLALIRSLRILLSGESITEEINDLDTSTLSSSYRVAAGHIYLPLTKDFNTVTQIQMALQSVGAGWSWVIVDKTTTVSGKIAPEIKIYDGTGTLADALIDAFARGV